MENGFSSPRHEVFPAGLRVLVVDDDPTWLKILEKMLKKCSYEVTTCGLAREALRLLRDRKDGFDIVISDVNMPDMDGFKLLEHVGLEMDLPVIMMSVDGETSRVMKGVQHGACDYLLKPIRMKELKNIWQHIVRKRLHEVRDIEYFDDRDHPNDGYYCGDPTLLKKRKDVDNEKESSDPSSSKKARVVWSIELHQKFVKAVNQIGIDSDKVGPKKILDLMNVPWLTRENVASHLQKYRLYLSRIGKGDDSMECSFGGSKNPDFFPKESSESHSLQNSSFPKQNNDVTSNLMYPASHLPVQSSESKPPEKKLKNKKMFNNENSDPQKANSQAGLNQTFQSLGTSTNYTSFNSLVSNNRFNPTPVPILQQQNQSDLLQPASQISPGLSIREKDGFCLTDVKPLIPKQISPLESVLEPFLVSNSEGFGCVSDVPWDVKNRNYSQDKHFHEQQPLGGSIFSWHSESRIKDPHDMKLEMKDQNLNSSRTPALGAESSFGLLGEDLMFRWLQGGDGSSTGFGNDDVGFSDSNFAEQVEVPFSPYGPKFGLEYEYPFEWMEYPVVDQGLLFS